MANKPRRFAEGTTVPASKTRIEIEDMLKKHGATSFIYGEHQGVGNLRFAMRNRHIMFRLQLVDEREQAAEHRRRWRVLLLTLKGKLESVADQTVETFEEAFLAHTVMPDRPAAGDAPGTTTVRRGATLSRPASENMRLAGLCRGALGSLDCELPRREKKVLEQIVVYSFELDLEWACFGSSDQLALQADLHKTDVSAALRSLERTRLIEKGRANPLAHFRKPMRYRVNVDALLRVAAAPATHNRADTAAWLINANRNYPLQPDLIAPDPRLLDIALAEISRASALAPEPVIQNGAPKPARPARDGEVSSPAVEAEEGSGWTLGYPAAELPTARVTPAEAQRKIVEMLARMAADPTASEEARREAQAQLDERTAGVVGNSPTTNPPSWKNSNYEPRAYQISGYSDGELNSPSGNPDGDARGPVGKIPTTGFDVAELNAALAIGSDPTMGKGAKPPAMARVLMLLTELGDPWQPPTAAREVFEQLRACMGGYMANYSGWWLPRCEDPEQRQDVLEAIATWKLARHSPKHKPWRGVAWRDEFFRRQRARLAATSTQEQPV